MARHQISTGVESAPTAMIFRALVLQNARVPNASMAAGTRASREVAAERSSGRFAAAR